MLSSMPRALLIASLILAVGCGGRGAATTATEVVVAPEIEYVDSLLNVMDARYNQLCDERKAAYSEPNPELRKVLLERNDAACKALEDSLRWVINSKRGGLYK